MLPHQIAIIMLPLIKEAVVEVKTLKTRYHRQAHRVQQKEKENKEVKDVLLTKKTVTLVQGKAKHPTHRHTPLPQNKHRLKALLKTSSM